MAGGHARGPARSQEGWYKYPMAQTTRRQLRTFPGLKAEDFQHPEDKSATKALSSVPGLDTVVAKLLEYGVERVLFLENIANNVQVTRAMFPRLFKYLDWACRVLDMEQPELYVSQNPAANAYTNGHTQPFIVLTSGLIDMLTDEELHFVIGHELGHIKAGHVLYGVLARNIAHLVTLIGQATFGLGNILGQGLVLALAEWQRKAELTADRAGLLAVQDLPTCMRAFMKLAGGAGRLYAEMDEKEFMRQIHAYEDADQSTLNKAYKVLLTAWRSHPFPIMRAKELDAWYLDGYPALAGPRGLLEP
jgi:Zn-dependent protease with chaperone function